MKFSLFNRLSNIFLLSMVFALVGCNVTEPSTSISNPSSVDEPSVEPSTEPSIEVDPFLGSLLYKLDFNVGEENKNSVENSYPNAIINGSNFIVEKETHKKSGILKFNNTSRDDTYFTLPASLLNNEVVTISTWVLMPQNMGDFNDQSPLFSIEYEDGYFCASPFDPGTWYGYSMHSKVDGGEDRNLTLAKPSKDTYWENTPTSGTLQSPAGVWHLIGFTFGSEYLEVFQNGKSMLKFNGNYSFKNKNITDFMIGHTSVFNVKDFNASISDFRVYNCALTETDYIREYQLTYNDFLTTDYQFNESFEENIRGFDAIPRGNAKFETKDDRKTVYLDGSTKGANTQSRTSLDLPNQVLLGHNQITISTDIYIVNTMDRYQRIFEFSIKGKRYFALYVGFSNANDLKLEYVPNQETLRHIALENSYTVPTDRWINITVTANENYGIIYVDGLPVAVGEEFKYNPVIMYYYPDLTCTIGRTDFYGDEPLTAYIDNFKMYSVALSEKEVMNANGIITIQDDNQAIQKAVDNFKIEYKHDTLLDLKKYAEEGVKLSYKSQDTDILDSNGRIYPDSKDHTARLDVTFSRGESSITKTFDIEIKKAKEVTRVVEDAAYEDVTYDEESYFSETMLANIDYLFTLDVEKLLYNYRLNAGLDTKGVTGYNGWISTQSGGAGQFETQYVGALARYTLTMPDYVGSTAPSATNTPLKRLTYMLNEIRKCQVAYGNKYPEQKGYLSAFTHLCIKAIESGSTAVNGGDGIHGTVPIEGVNAWVPYYMYHKNLMMCYDVYTHIKDDNLKDLAYSMLVDASDWVYNEISSLDETQRANTLSFEYGGMSEVSYLTYKVTQDKKYLRTAVFFEQESLLEGLYNNTNCLKGLHSNTTIPKILGCAAAYEVTGNEYYKVICENFFEMIKNDMSYANGGVSLDEHFEEPGVTTQAYYTEETCCSYNMLMLTNYLYRWTKKASYFDYFENVFYNHIMGSIDPNTGGKTYPNPTDFGHHKIFSAAVDAFWCCCCTGQETFSKLVYGNIYKDDSSTYINMYNPVTYKIDDAKLSITGNLFTDEKVHIVVNKTKNITLKLRVPKWTTPVLKLNGQVLSYQADSLGYISINRTFSASDDLVVELPMKARLEEQKGTRKSFALFYGPLMFVANLGKQTGDTYISTSQSSTNKGVGWINFDGDYNGPLTQYIVISNFDKNKINDYINKSIVDGKVVISIVGKNQTTNFIPFMDCVYERYSMYMYYVSE